ncbi:MAG: (2Fe-2S)-binding protein [Candidatus Acidiferrales bacterium]
MTEADAITVRVNGRRIQVPTGATASVAMLIAGDRCRTSVTGEPRGPLCGMGVCFECRVAIDGRRHQRGCQILCVEGMEISSNDSSQ